MFNLRDVFFAFTWIAVLMLLGRVLKQRMRWIQMLYLPESVVAGVLALLLGSQVLGAVAQAWGGAEHWLAGGVFAPAIREVWRQSPSVFINIVFAALFLGEKIPTPLDIWRKAAPQVVFGQALAWGQYVVGILITAVILIPFFDAHPISATLIEIAFEGGHGTAGGMAETLRNLGFTDGPDLALGLATVGLISGIVAGTALAEWARQKHYIETFAPQVPESGEIPELFPMADTPEIKRKRAKLLHDLLIDPLSLNFGFVGIAVVIGWLLQQGLVQIEAFTWGPMGLKVMVYVPLFPMALLGGMILQLVLERLGLECLIIPPLMKSIAGVALDVVVVTALASISLVVIGSNISTFIILSAAGIAWNVLFFLYYAPRIFPDYWFEKGIADMGQSMGVTATGILLLRMVDPTNKSGAFESFAYKQLFFEPIVGGGLFTAAAPVLIHTFGLWPSLLLTGGILVFWLVIGFLLMSSRQVRS
ncbi:MAG: sodium/glutamate symporter [Gloeomargarita sp. HHBFW_bins_162]